jgi:hypothetical protein
MSRRLLHQTDAPTTEFEGGPSATLKLQLPFMAYIKANGGEAFCDGRPATPGSARGTIDHKSALCASVFVGVGV